MSNDLAKQIGREYTAAVQFFLSDLEKEGVEKAEALNAVFSAVLVIYSKEHGREVTAAQLRDIADDLDALENPESRH